jgi:4-amino-4-deoxy-L-arabinose transferase-like glycosyltransferase
MIQAWLVLPALAAAYLLAAPAARLRTRCAHVALAGLVTAVVSLSWMAAVSLVPSQDRPEPARQPKGSGGARCCCLLAHLLPWLGCWCPGWPRARAMEWRVA